jgi:hypothetical protein
VRGAHIRPRRRGLAAETVALVRSWADQARLASTTGAVLGTLLASLAAGDGLAVELHQATVARTINRGLRSVERAFAALRRLGAVVEVPSLRSHPPTQDDEGRWTSGPKAWTVNTELAFEHFGITPPTADEAADRRRRAAHTDPPLPPGPKGSHSKKSVTDPAAPVDESPELTTPAAIRRFMNWPAAP